MAQNQSPAQHPSAAAHQYRYDGPEFQRMVDEMKRDHEYLELRVGATLTSKQRLFTVTAVHQDGVALLVEGTIKNLTKQTMFVEPFSMLLNESPDRQMKWFKAHPVTMEYHYGPGFNSHAESSAQMDRVEPGRTGTFVVVWNVSLETIASEPPADLVLTF